MRCRYCPTEVTPLRYAKGLRSCGQCRVRIKHLPDPDSIQEPLNAREQAEADELIAAHKAEVRSRWRDGVQRAL